jgi:predicted metal-binding membrane protein
MWTAMMGLMMAPVAWPWIVAFRHVLAPDCDGRARLATTTSFVCGYVTAWLTYAVAAATLQAGLQAAEWLDVDGTAGRAAGAAILIGAGVFQLTPIKRACLTHCRNPLSFLLTSWLRTPPSGFRIGLAHGIYCVACCWALMLTMLALGLSNLAWMAALTAAVFIEQTVRRGDRVRVPLGIALVAAGLLRL